MNRLIIVLIISIISISCSTSNKDKSETKNLELYKKQVKELNIKIANIEKERNKSDYIGIAIPVTIEKVKTQYFSHNFIAIGELESISYAFISSEINGQIVSVNVLEGEHVKKGQLLAKLNTAIIENTINEVKTQLTLAKTIYDKQAILWNKNIGSEQQYLVAKNNFENLKNKLKTMAAQYNMAIIKSPIDGIVDKILLKKGEMASPGIEFMQVVNINKLYVTLQLSEAYLPVIKKGDSVNISFSAYPGITYREPIYRVGNVINKQNRTFEVQIKINNKNGELKPNLLATVNINDYNTSTAIVLPSTIIKQDMKGSFVYIVKNKDNNKIAVKIYIKTGVSYMDKTEVVDGLQIGDLVILQGYNKVSNGSVIKILSE